MTSTNLLPTVYLFIWILILSVVFVSDLEAQNPDIPTPKEKPLLRESGFIAGFGNKWIDQGQKVETMPMIWRYGLDAKELLPALKCLKGDWSIVLEPQICPIIKPDKEIEFGIGVGIQYAYALSKKCHPYLFAVIGPHFITAGTEDQTMGFIFSESVGAGVYLFLNQRTALNLGYRYRHLSNAGLAYPNGGINHHIGVVGFSCFY